jgi:hypothetical protein
MSFAVRPRDVCVSTAHVSPEAGFVSPTNWSPRYRDHVLASKESLDACRRLYCHLFARGLNRTAGPPVHDDLVQRRFTALSGRRLQWQKLQRSGEVAVEAS